MPHEVYVTEAQAKANAAYRAKKEAQRVAREQRFEEQQKRHPQTQLARLDVKFGKGAAKERARLQQYLRRAKRR